MKVRAAKLLFAVIVMAFASSMPAVGAHCFTACAAECGCASDDEVCRQSCEDYCRCQCKPEYFCY